MFYTPKPRQFHYRPRFYDPKKEEWELLKAKYRLEEGLPLDDEERVRVAREEEAAASKPAEGIAEAVAAGTDEGEAADDELAYFRRRVRELDRKEREASRKLTVKDFFRKRDKPQFHYVSRFDADGNLIETPAASTEESVVKRRIKRRFDDEEDWGRLEPIPAGKIMIYVLIVCLLLLFIFGNDLPIGVRGE